MPIDRIYRIANSMYRTMLDLGHNREWALRTATVYVNYAIRNR